MAPQTYVQVEGRATSRVSLIVYFIDPQRHADAVARFIRQHAATPATAPHEFSPPDQEPGAA